MKPWGGNLCRCTGYRPIVAAVEQALGERSGDKFDHRASVTQRMLEGFLSATANQETAQTSTGTSYHLPRSAVETAELLARHPGSRIVAGGTDLMLEVTQQLHSFESLIDLRSATDLQSIEVSDTGIDLGAAVTHAESCAPLFADYPELAELIERFGSLQIRSQGTVVGNVANASPIGDWPPVMLALEGTLSLQSTEGIRTLAVDEFFLDYRKTALRENEFIARAHFPRRADNLFLRAYKISKRYEDDISSVCLVLALRMDGDRVISARVACGGMAATPKRAAQCERAFADLNLRDGDLKNAIAALEADFSPISDARASAGYRRSTVANLLHRLQAEYRGERNTRAHSVAYTTERAM